MDETLNEGYGKTLWNMEDEVQVIKDDMGKAVLAAKLPKIIKVGLRRIWNFPETERNGWMKYSRNIL